MSEALKEEIFIKHSRKLPEFCKRVSFATRTEKKIPSGTTEKGRIFFPKNASALKRASFSV